VHDYDYDYDCASARSDQGLMIPARRLGCAGNRASAGDLARLVARADRGLGGDSA
jgi:hypothetical protein